jgi:hypothetical protein
MYWVISRGISAVKSETPQIEPVVTLADQGLNDPLGRRGRAQFSPPCAMRG